MKKNIPQYAYLNNEDLKFLASGCFCSFYNREIKCIKEDYKDEMRQYVLNNSTNTELELTHIAPGFPRIQGFFLTETFNNFGDVSKYFEFLGDIKKDGYDKDNCSHNVVLYAQQEEIKNSIAKYFDNEMCAVKIVDLEKNTTWGLGGVYSYLNFDFDYLNIKNEGQYYLTHGATDSGLTIIKKIDETQFNSMKTWFEKLHKIPENNFVKNKQQIEKIILERYSL